MLKNTASQSISALILDTSADPVTTGTTTVYVTGDAGTQASAGTGTHEGNGVWSFLPSQANTNYDEISFLFTSDAANAVHSHLTVYTDASYDLVGALNDISTTDVNTQVDSAIETYHLHYLFHTTYDPASPPGVTDALLNELVENDAGESRFTTNALENAPGGSANTALLQSTTILSYTSNTQFTLNAGSADNDAYNNQMAVIVDQATGTQKAVGLITDYTGSSKTIFLDADPGVFTYANGDTINIFAVSGGAVPLEIDTSGRVDIGSVAGTSQTAGDLASLITTVDTAVDGIQSDLSNGTDGLGALSADIATAQADLDIITGADGVNLLSATQTQINDILTDTGTTLDGKIGTIDTEVGNIQADLDNGTDGLGAIKTETAAIKTKTDSLTFTVANQVDSNIQSVDDAAISEGGSAPASPYGQT